MRACTTVARDTRGAANVCLVLNNTGSLMARGDPGDMR